LSDKVLALVSVWSKMQRRHGHSVNSVGGNHLMGHVDMAACLQAWVTHADNPELSPWFHPGPGNQWRLFQKFT